MNATGTGLVRYLRTLAEGRANDACTDRQLLEQFVTRREQASFAALVRRHGPMVLSVCRRVLSHDQDAEDAFQATFLVLVRKAGSIRKHESVSSWLHGVAYRVAEKLRAKEARRMAHERKAASRPSVDPTDDVAWREIRCLLDNELARLPEQYRGPLVLCYLQGKTQDEAARHLEWSLRTFRRRLKSARDLLTRRLSRRGITLSAALTAPLLMDTAAQAALPPLLAAGTIRAGMACAMGEATETLASAQVIALAESGACSLLAKKASVVLVVLASLALGIGGLLANRAVNSRTPAEAPPAPPAQATPRPQAALADKDNRVEIKGRVLDPDGKPLTGAHLFLLSTDNAKNAKASIRATTDKEGRFAFSADSADFGLSGKGQLAATAKGFGLDWTEVDAKKGSEEITLRLVADDTPIEGRVLDLEGNPVSGVKVQVRSVARRADGKDLATFVATVEKYLKEGTPDFLSDAYQPNALNAALNKFQWRRVAPARLDTPAMATTGADGRFRLTGFGRGRILELAIRGPTIGHSLLHVLTQIGPAKGWVPGHWGLYGARFEWLAAPCKPIVGTVRDKRTGKPLAGITVGVSGPMWTEAKTDDQGRYRVLGATKSKEYDVGAGTMPYFDSEQHVADTPGLEPITVDFELEQGIVVRGRLIEKTTGKPVHGDISFNALAENPHLKDFANVRRPSSARTAADGSFTVTAIPGPGLLLVTADDVKRFAAAEDKGWKIATGGLLLPHAVVPINPSKEDDKSRTCDIVLEPARLLEGSVFGPDNRPLAGAYAAGCWPIVQAEIFDHEKLSSNAFTVGGLKAGRPRVLAFYHLQKKLGKALVLRGDETKPLEVRLEPLGAITGRILDAKGRPWAGLNMLVVVTPKDKTYPPELHWVPSSWFKLMRFELKADGEGRFRIDGLVPGLKYELFAAEGEIVIQPDVASPYRAEGLTVESGKVKDLGDLKSKQVPEK